MSSNIPYNLRPRIQNNENISNAQGLAIKNCCVCNPCECTAEKTSDLRIPKQKDLNTKSEIPDLKEMYDELNKIELNLEESTNFDSIESSEPSSENSVNTSEINKKTLKINKLRSEIDRNSNSRLKNIGLEKEKITQMNSYLVEHGIGKRKK